MFIARICSFLKTLRAETVLQPLRLRGAERYQAPSLFLTLALCLSSLMDSASSLYRWLCCNPFSVWGWWPCQGFQLSVLQIWLMWEPSIQIKPEAQTHSKWRLHYISVLFKETVGRTALRTKFQGQPAIWWHAFLCECMLLRHGGQEAQSRNGDSLRHSFVHRIFLPFVFSSYSFPHIFVSLILYTICN